MADVAPGGLTRDELLAEIRARQDELEALEVKRERIPLFRTPDAELPEILDSLQEQLKTRKRFLRVNKKTECRPSPPRRLALREPN